MEAIVLLILFFVMMLTGMPVAIGLGVCIVLFCTIFPIGSLAFITQNMFAATESFPLLAIPFFVLTGILMESGGLSQRLVNFANSLVGNMTSGLAVVTVTACMFFGAISGSAPATVAAIGGIMIPHMVKANYGKPFATGLVTTSGSLGVIIPPSIPLVIYGISTATNIGDLFIAGVIPGLLIGMVLMVISYVIGKKRGYQGTGGKVSFGSISRTFWDAKWAVLLPVIILGGIYSGTFTPTEASIVGAFYSIIVGLFIYKELTVKAIYEALYENATIIGTMFLLFGFALSLSFVISIIDIPYTISEYLMSVTDNKYVILIIINVFLLFIGMILDPTSANLIFSPILLAIVQQFGVDPVHFGIVVTINLALGFVTPPMAGNVFLASTLTGVPVTQIFKESAPFVIGMMVCLLLITFFPVISLAPLTLFG